MANLLALSAILWAGTLTGGDPVQQGTDQGTYQRNSVQEVENRLALYLNGEAVKSILTPGETVDWKQSLKAGQVLVADASSDAFDPALEVVGSDDKVLAMNDDRYPGDQRPLLFWRCGADGDYRVRVRCFQNKAGGQVFVRFNTYDTLDIPASGEPVEGSVDATKPFLVRIPMKAGQVKDVMSEKMGERDYLRYQFNTVIFPNGLPERAPSLAQPLAPAIRALVAPLDGDYYLLQSPYGSRDGRGRVRMYTRDFVPKPVGTETPTNVPALFELTVKAGDLLEVSTPELKPSANLTVSESPDFTKYVIDPKKPELNPFIPQVKNQPVPEPAFDSLPARDRDNRITIFRARRDARLWVASDGAGLGAKQFTIHVRPAAIPFAEGSANAGKLKIANTDYWAFDGKAGDVMSLGIVANGFAPLVLVRDPDLGELRHWEAPIDENSDKWRMIIQKPGRYLVAVAGLGNGASGDYSLSREVFHAQEFGRGHPAKGEIGEGQIQIWKLTLAAKDPVLVHWTSSDWSYESPVYDEHGSPVGFPAGAVDEHNRFGILSSPMARTYVIVLIGHGPKATYSIELTDIPGYTKPAKGKG